MRDSFDEWWSGRLEEAVRIFRTAIKSGTPDGVTCTLYIIYCYNIGISAERRPTTLAAADAPPPNIIILLCAVRTFVVNAVQYRVVCPSCRIVRFAKSYNSILRVETFFFFSKVFGSLVLWRLRQRLCCETNNDPHHP